ncbi:MAG: porphobilinogen synthase [Phycisphaeraceae bacterium]|nr:porphobilinogen synthase [Phycisphaeraceae bacterium]
MPQPPSPRSRLRRLRRGQRLRDAVADVTLDPSNLICPIFVKAEGEAEPVESMPGVNRLNPRDATAMITGLSKRGLQQFLLFGVIDEAAKDETGSPALDPDNPVAATLKATRDAGADALLYADLCFCEYTDHGHCGVISDDRRLTVDNDATLEPLGRQAAMLAEAGADVIAPSGMMDGQVAAVRTALDQAGHDHTAILSYAVKYASSFYGPFRDAGGGGMSFGDRRGYQMDYRRSREWRSELAADLAEGADMVMVKPAMAYLDVIAGVRDACDVPVAAYHVSGEYAMLHAAAERGWLDLDEAAMESTLAIRRAGADLIITYFAEQLLDAIS